MFTLPFPKTQQGASLNLESVLAAATKHQNEGRYAEPLDIESWSCCHLLLGLGGGGGGSGGLPVLHVCWIVTCYLVELVYIYYTINTERVYLYAMSKIDAKSPTQLIPFFLDCLVLLVFLQSPL